MLHQTRTVISLYLKGSSVKKNYIAYHGREFDIEWYFDEKGKAPALEYFNELTLEQKRKAVNLFKLMGEQGEVSNIEKFRYEGDQVYAFKVLPDRFLCFFHKDAKVIITNAFAKKSQKMPKNEKERALRHKENYLIRFKKGTYYD